MRRSPAGRPSARAGFRERLMVAKVRDLRSSAAAVSYYEKDGYYAKDDPEHRDASFWHGGAAKELGLKAHVLPRGFESVLAGYVPGTEIRLGRMREGENDRRPGWDLTLSAPKSVSLEALVVGDRRVIRAHDDAVRATLDWVEKELLQTRGFDPATRRRPRVAANGMAVAGFRHLTSRIGDPQLHTHCVLANMTRNVSGEWRSVEPTSIKRSEKLIGAVYRNELARRLQALGMAVTARMIGRVPGFELAGYDRSFMDAFSGRRAEILAWLKEHDLPYTAKNAETAALHTRPSKQDTRLSDLVPQWRERARELGLARDRGALRPDRPIDPVTGERAEPVEVPPPDLPANELRSLRRAPALPRLPRDAAGERAVSARSGAPAELLPVPTPTLKSSGILHGNPDTRSIPGTTTNSRDPAPSASSLQPFQDPPPASDAPLPKTTVSGIPKAPPDRLPSAPTPSEEPRNASQDVTQAAQSASQQARIRHGIPNSPDRNQALRRLQRRTRHPSPLLALPPPLVPARLRVQIPNRSQLTRFG